MLKYIESFTVFGGGYPPHELLIFLDPPDKPESKKRCESTPFHGES